VTAREKIDAAVNDLLSRGVSWHTAAPPHYRLMWAMGWYVPPMLFQSFVGIFVFNAVVGGMVFAAMAWFFERHHSPVELMLTLGPIGGAAMGLVLATVSRFHTWRLGLPRWADYNPHHEEDAEDAGW
jgi:hypothetical protein